LNSYRRVVVSGLMLSSFTIADALAYLTFQQRTSMSLKYFPLLFAGTASIYTLLALPFGRMADRFRPARIFLFGQFLLIVVDLMLLPRDPGPLALVVLVVALGTSYAASDGVLAALTSSLLPSSLRTTGLAVLGSAAAIGAFVASILYGALWGWYGADTAVRVFLVGLVVAWTGAFVLLAPLRRSLATPPEPLDQPRSSVTD
jgi:MFS family permease